MKEQPQKTVSRGYWYETNEEGKRLLCFKTRFSGKTVVRKLELPEGVLELKPLRSKK